MILIGLGSNLPGPWGPPAATIRKAIATLNRGPCRIVRSSRPVITPPFGNINQPDFVNAVVRLRTCLSARDLMRHLHRLEARAGRTRRQHWGPRTLDLDLLDYHGSTIQRGGRLLTGSRRQFTLPHPGLTDRAFVLRSVCEVAPYWHHPVTGMTAEAQLAVSNGQ